jgi:hypothetical protein
VSEPVVRNLTRLFRANTVVDRLSEVPRESRAVGTGSESVVETAALLRRSGSNVQQHDQRERLGSLAAAKHIDTLPEKCWLSYRPTLLIHFSLLLGERVATHEAAVAHKFRKSSRTSRCPLQISLRDQSNTTTGASMRYPAAQSIGESTGGAGDQVLAKHRYLKPTSRNWYGGPLVDDSHPANRARGRAMIAAAATDFCSHEMVTDANLAEQLLR